jgi:hypothetical protein
MREQFSEQKELKWTGSCCMSLVEVASYHEQEEIIIFLARRW